MFLSLRVLLSVILYNGAVNAYRKPVKYNQTQPSPKFHNPNYIRDRLKNEIHKPRMPDTWINQDQQPFNSAWMDYCDPYHCNDYHRLACGLNRNTMKFKWFQSQCHIILNNQCAEFRGSLKYDIIDTKYCTAFAQHLRTGCPSSCDDEVIPICGVSTVKNHAVLFKNSCAFEMANCQAVIESYEEVNMAVCDYYIRHAYLTK